MDLGVFIWWLARNARAVPTTQFTSYFRKPRPDGV